jgi:hypothetical protein
MMSQSLLSRSMRRVRQAYRVLIGKASPFDAPPARPPIPPLTPEEVQEARLFFPMDKFFIFGHARSGTTLLARLVRLHPQVHCNWQAHFFTRKPLLKSLVDDPEVAAWLSHNSNRWNRGKDLSPVILRAVSDFILERDARRLGKSIVGDKSPSSINDGEAVRNLHHVYPDAALVFIVRDGRDTAISHRFQDFVDRMDRIPEEDKLIYTELTKDPEPFLQGERSLFTEKGIRKLAQGWVKNLVETEAEGKKLFGKHYYHLRYEDLLAQTWEEMCRLWAFLKASDFDETLRQAVEAEKDANPDADWQKQKDQAISKLIQKGRQGNWRSLFTPRDREIFKEIAGQALVDWGYEKDMDW